MATTTPNYGWPVPTNTDYVKDGAENIAALGDAIDATVFGLPGSGLTLINTTTFTAVASQSFNNVFTSTYANYLINFQIVQNTVIANLGFRLRVAGADNTTSNYFNMITGLTTAASADNIVNSGATSSLFSRGLTGAPAFANLNFFNPQGTTNTSFTAIGQGVDTIGRGTSYAGAGLFNTTAQFDGITFIASAGTMTGTIRIYGYQN